jgi:hypothetical protein
MNISWGVKITILYSSFVGMILFMVYLTMQEKIELVAPDYYKQEIEYQGKINGMQNAGELMSGIIILPAKDKTIEINFPADFAANAKGDITFFRPSDSELDEQFVLQVGSDFKQAVQLKKGKRGLYKVKVNALVNNKPYYFEESFFLN